MNGICSINEKSFQDLLGYRVMVTLIVTLIIVTFSSLMPFCYSQDDSQNATSNMTSQSDLSVGNWTTYTNEVLGISFDYPADWDVKEKENRFVADSDVTTSHGITSFTFSKFDPTLNGMLDKLGLAKSVNQFERIYGQGSRIIESTDMKKYEIDGERAGTFLYTIEKADGTTIAQQKIIVQHEDSGYSLNFQDSVQTFDTPETQNIMNNILESFKFLNVIGG